jgi:hypothetical protein
LLAEVPPAWFAYEKFFAYYFFLAAAYFGSLFT